MFTVIVNLAYLDKIMSSTNYATEVKKRKGGGDVILEFLYENSVSLFLLAFLGDSFGGSSTLFV